MFPTTGQGVTRSRAIAHVRWKPASQPSARTHRSKAGMAASQHSSTSSSTDSATERTQQQAGAGPAGVQQLFDAWINAWRSLGVPGVANGGPFQMPQMPPMPAMPDFGNAAAAMGQFAGLKLPTAAIPAERLQKLQADYSREAMQLLQQSADSKSKAPELKDRRFSSDAWSAAPAYAFTAAWYLLNARYLQELVEALDTEPKVRERIRFAVQQWTAATSPS